MDDNTLIFKLAALGAGFVLVFLTLLRLPLDRVRRFGLSFRDWCLGFDFFPDADMRTPQPSNATGAFVFLPAGDVEIDVWTTNYDHLLEQCDRAFFFRIPHHGMAPYIDAPHESRLQRLMRIIKRWRR
jgi:hypothetical protein